jgi:hypothetical protein
MDQKDPTAKKKSTGHSDNPYPWDEPKKKNTWTCCGKVWPKTYYVCPECELDRPEE